MTPWQPSINPIVLRLMIEQQENQPMQPSGLMTSVPMPVIKPLVRPAIMDGNDMTGILDDFPWVKTDELDSYYRGVFPDFKWRSPGYPLGTQNDYVRAFLDSIYSKRDSLLRDRLSITLGEDISPAQALDLARTGRLVAYSFQHRKSTVVMLDGKELITFLDPVIECEGLQITGKIQYSLPKDSTL